MKLACLALILCATALLAGAPRSTPPGAELAPDSETRWVPFTLTPGNQIRFTMQLDGRPVGAILDTGVSYSLVAARYARANRLATRPGGNASAIGGDVAIAWMPVRRLTIGGLTRTGGGIGVADLPAQSTGSAAPIDMLVGRDLLADYALDIDYDAHRFRLLSSGRLPFAGASAPLAVSPTRMVYVSQLTLGDTKLAPMLLDTGDGSALTLSAASWRQIPRTSIKLTDTISFGIGGAIVTGLAIIPQARIGELTARNVEMRIEDGEGFSQSIGMAGRIGSGFLQHYRVLLDPNAGRMVLAPGAHAGAMPQRSTSGLLMGIDKGALVVLHVMRGSPAATAGWKEGERICSVDDIAVPRDYAASPLAKWSADTPGRVVRLGMCDGGKRRLTLRNFY